MLTTMEKLISIGVAIAADIAAYGPYAGFNCL